MSDTDFLNHATASLSLLQFSLAVPALFFIFSSQSSDTPKLVNVVQMVSELRCYGFTMIQHTL